jgi:hypothetical protein
MLNTSEQLLVKEVAKLRKQKAEEMQKKPTAVANADENDSNDTGTNGAPVINEFQQSIISSYSNPLHHKERAIIEFLLKNSMQKL